MRGMRWLILILGLAAALVAGFVLLQGSGAKLPGGPPPLTEANSLSTEHDEIDEDSRKRLRDILRAARSEGEKN